MSYILDALKKSEQERGHGHIPNVQTVHTSSLSYKNKKTYWPYVLITAILLNLAAIVYFYLNKDTPSTDVTVTSEEKITPDISSNAHNNIINNRTEPANTIVSNNEKPETENSGQQINSPPETTYDNETSKLDISSVVDFHDLPESIKKQLPTINISAHVYSSNPLQRSIVINNNFMEEGEYVLDGLILQEITQDGAIMFYQGRSFHYEVLSGWQ